MLEKVNLENKLKEVRAKKFKNSNDILEAYLQLLNKDDENRNRIRESLTEENSEKSNTFNTDQLESARVFHVSQIRKICIDYRLRFLDTAYFKDTYPEEAISEINNLEKIHNTTFSNFKIVAPIDVFKLRKADDPLLFLPMGNGYHYLVHKWGNDVSPLRKLKYWSIKNIENLLVSLTLISIVFTALTYPFFLTQDPSFGYLLMLFMFYFKGVVGMFFIFCGGRGKNFSEYSWQSQYDKIQ